jgi:hypothetical protein
MKMPYNYGVRYWTASAPHHPRRSRAAGAKRIIRCRAVAAFVCPAPVIAGLVYVAFFNNIGARQMKKSLRATGNGFTTKH